MTKRPPIRVLHFISELSPGGTELQLVTLLPHVRPGFEHIVCAAIGYGAVGTALQHLGIKVVYLNAAGRWDPRLWLRFYQTLRRESPDIIVTYLVLADVVGAIMGRLYRQAKIISSQRSSHHRRTYLWKTHYLIGRLVNAYIVQTDSAGKKIKRLLGNTAPPIHVIPNAVNLNLATQLSVQEVSETTRRIIICVSNLRPGKGHKVLLDAFEHLYHQNRVKGWQLVLVGHGSLATPLQNYTASLASKHSIVWLGQQDRVANFLAHSQIFVLPSFAEGMSNALLEAQAAGLACVASDIPPNQAVIGHGKTGLLFPVGKYLALAASIQKLIEDESYRATLGTKARQFVEGHHSPLHIAERWRLTLRTIVV